MQMSIFRSHTQKKKSQAWAKPSAPPATRVPGKGGREADDTQQDPTRPGPQREEGGEMRLGLPAA